MLPKNATPIRRRPPRGNTDTTKPLARRLGRSCRRGFGGRRFARNTPRSIASWPPASCVRWPSEIENETAEPRMNTNKHEFHQALREALAIKRKGFFRPSELVFIRVHSWFFTAV